MTTKDKLEAPGTLDDAASQLNTLSCRLQGVAEILELYCIHHGQSTIPFLVRDDIKRAYGHLNDLAGYLELMHREQEATGI